MKFSWKSIKNWRSWKMRFFELAIFISMKTSSPFIWGIIYFCTMDGFFRILEKTSSELICTRLYLFILNGDKWQLIHDFTTLEPNFFHQSISQAYIVLGMYNVWNRSPGINHPLVGNEVCNVETNIDRPVHVHLSKFIQIFSWVDPNFI